MQSLNVEEKLPTEGGGLEFEFRPVVCPVCSSDCPKFLGWRGGEAHHLGSGVRTSIVRCRTCTHLYPNPMPFPKQSLDQLYTNPDSYFKGHDVERKKFVGMELLREFEVALGRRGRYLDVGCGRGEWLWAARQAGWEFEGVDPSSTYIEWARRNLEVEGRPVTLEEAHFSENYFDAVSLSGLIEHLYEPYITLREVYRILRPGGLLWFDAPNEDGLYMRAGNLYMRAQGRDWVVCLAPTFPPFHVQGFNQSSLRRLLTRVGLELERVEISGGVWPFTGRQSLRKQIEYQAARLVNWVGNRAGMGSYMSVWARKPGKYKDLPELSSLGGD
jgi:SAM-dependent methyltransferase